LMLRLLDFFLLSGIVSTLPFVSPCAWLHLAQVARRLPATMNWSSMTRSDRPHHQTR
jgi:hypothetical protein